MPVVSRRIRVRVGALLRTIAFASSVFAASLEPGATVAGQTGEAGAQESPTRAAAPPIELFDTPDLRIGKGDPVLRIRVQDSASGKPVESFLAVAGVDVRDTLVDPAFVAEHGRDMIVNWQPHMVREGKDGEYAWPLARAYSPLGLRIEAEGYLPMRFTWIDKKRGSQTIVFRLIKDLGIVGMVTLPGGEAAAGAEVAIKMVSRSPTMQGCSFGFGRPEPDDCRDRWRRGVVRKADAHGQFTLPTETDPSAFVVAIHERGTCQVPFAEFEGRRILELREWGRVEGTVLIGSEPTADVRVTAYNTRFQSAAYPDPFLYYYDLQSDEEGRFVIERFPPGSGEWALPEFVPRHDGTGPGGWSYIPPIPRNSMGRFRVEPGETTVVTLGGEGLGPGRVDDQRGSERSGDGGGPRDPGRRVGMTAR